MRRTERHILPTLARLPSLATVALVVAACSTTPSGQGSHALGRAPDGAVPVVDLPPKGLPDGAPDAGLVVIGPTPNAAVGSDGSASSDATAFVRTNFGVTTDPRNPPPPLSGGTLTVLAGSKLAVASDPDRDHVVVADLVAWKVAFDIALRPHDEPGRIVEGVAGTVYVALRRGGAVVTIDTSTGTLTERRAVCSAPRGLAYDAATTLLHVACAGGELVSLPAIGGPEARRLVLDGDLRDVVVSGTDLFVSRFRAAELLTVSAAGAVTARALPKPTDNTFAPAVAWRLRAMPGGSIVMVHQGGLASAIPLDGKPDASVSGTVGTYTSSSPCTSIVTTMVTIFAPSAATSSYLVSGTVLPIDVAIDPRSGAPAVIHAAAANTPSTILPISLVNLDASKASFCQPQQAPQVPGVPATRPPGQLVAIDGSDAGALFVQTREPATLWRDDGRVLQLSSESHADVGHALFHADVNGLACASCHPEGGEDGRVWKFSPIGARRTPSLRGGIAGTEPFHWDGDLPTLSSLMSEVFVRRMAGPVLEPDQTDALYRWINAIPALPAVVADVAAVARGRALFADANTGCSTCHAGALLTNNATVDVGTGQPLQVPSLRGVAWRAPYLHNGCAPTLLDRFGPCGGGESHGHTAALTATERADLVSYLQSL
jgi:mono/diheme cytochrome c family protein